MVTRYRYVLAMLAATVACTPPDGDPLPTAEEQAVIDAVDQLFEAMRTRDTLSLRSILAPEARLVALLEDGSNRASTAEEFLATFGSEGPEIVERMWDPEVRIEAGLATVWAPYDLYRGQAFSHCGVDAFHLGYVDGFWQIFAIAYTVQRTDCAPSPLGAPFE